MIRCFLLLFLFLLPCVVNAASWQPGFRTIGYHAAGSGARLDLNVWYPANRSPSVLNYSPWRIRGSLNAKPAAGPFPLLVLSHPSSGNRFSFSALAARLASQGFMVVCPTHVHDNAANMDNLFSWKHFTERITEIEKSIEIVLKEPMFAGIADAQRIGFIGFGAGAAAGLLLGGALPDCAGWKAYCDAEKREDVYCAHAARSGLDGMCANFPLHKSLADSRIKAMALISPGYGMLFGKEAFKYFYPPVLLVEVGRDQFNKPEYHTRAIGRGLGDKALYLAVPEADMGAMMDECPELLLRELPELCLSVQADERRSIRRSLEKALYSFFGHYLLDKANIPAIPAPPDLAPPPAKVEESSAAPKSLAAAGAAVKCMGAQLLSGKGSSLIIGYDKKKC